MSFEQSGHPAAVSAAENPPGKVKSFFALVGLVCRRGLLAVRFRWGLLRLKMQSSRFGLRLMRSWQSLRALGRHFRLSWGLILCTAVTVAAILLTVLTRGAPELRALGGTALPAESLLVIDPYRRVETELTPDHLYDRPIAAAQTGSEPLLLRIRLEESLLTIRRDDKGLVVTPLPGLAPGDTYTPRLVDEATALRMLVEGEFCAEDATWAQAAQERISDSRLPQTEGASEKILVFEKKTVENPLNVSVDLSSLLPEDLEALGINKATYTHIGFYDRGEGAYQLLYISAEDPPAGSDALPDITRLSYQYYAWDVAEEAVRLYGTEETPAVQLGMPDLRPLSEWKEPTKTWFYDEDGWVYYGDVLHAGEITPLLLANFYVLSDSFYANAEENRYRLEPRQQCVVLNFDASFNANRSAILAVWDTHGELNGIGSNQMSQTAGGFALGMLQALGIG